MIGQGRDKIFLWISRMVHVFFCSILIFVCCLYHQNISFTIFESIRNKMMRIWHHQQYVSVHDCKAQGEMNEIPSSVLFPLRSFLLSLVDKKVLSEIFLLQEAPANLKKSFFVENYFVHTNRIKRNTIGKASFFSSFYLSFVSTLTFLFWLHNF